MIYMRILCATLSVIAVCLLAYWFWLSYLPSPPKEYICQPLVGSTHPTTLCRQSASRVHSFDLICPQ